ncbi:MAG: HD domain-containing protein [Labilithrix sp.]|nr:HD domain-containing protein [Labilithrix sp.]MBX3210884.1 HD domain-containing protein [Labilithrix sp.]
MSVRRVTTVDEARAVLRELGAPDRLVRHGALVLEAAELLLERVRVLGVSVDDGLVRAGVMLHDTGKILHPNELAGGGSNHEEAGRGLLLERGIDPAVARCCVTHAQWASHECSLEELLVALADALWKGVRRDELERRVVDAMARRLMVDPWSIYVTLDTCFEEVADGGSERLSRSV